MSYDCIIIGGGSAGYAAARTAAAAGLKTAVVDGAEVLSGLCILRGCMPSKTLLASSSRYHSMTRAAEFGLRASNLEVHGGEIIARKRRLIGEFAAYRQEQLQDGRFELVRGLARFVDASTIQVALRDGGRREMSGKTFIIATGSVVAPPPLQSLAKAGYWTSDDVLDAEHIPDSVIILGGGAIAVEFATYYNGLGKQTTLIQRSSHVLKDMDKDLAEALVDGLRERGMAVFTCTKLVDVERNESGFRVDFEQDGKLLSTHAAQLVNCLGRVPAVEGLGLDATGMEVIANRPRMHPTQQTSLPHIFTAGDVAGPHEVVHIAIQQGEIAARNAARLLKGKGEALETMDYRLKLFAVFSDPEVAACGASEHELRAAGIEYRAAKYPFADHGKSMTMGETDGFVKLLAAPNGEILGGSVVGPHASELIHEIVVAMQFRATAAQLATVPHYHPTLSEIWTYPAEELA